MYEKYERLGVALPFLVLIVMGVGIVFMTAEIRDRQRKESLPLRAAVRRVLWGSNEYLTIVACLASALLVLPFIVCRQVSANAVGSFLVLALIGWYLVLSLLRWATRRNTGRK